MYETLEGFLTGYLHQDWDVDYDTDTDAAVDFATKEPLPSIKLLLGEIALLTAVSDDERFDSILKSFHLDYLPSDDSLRAWLRRLSASIASTAATRVH